MTREKQIIKDSYTVLLPAFTELSLSDTIIDFLKKGGCSILVAETREEYVDREMSIERKQIETQDSIKNLVDRAKEIQPNLIVAIDQEIVGINRLHVLSLNTPNKETLKQINSTNLELICSKIANDARKMGVNCFLAPTLDIVKGDNPWLLGRTWTTNVDELVKISAAFVNGVQKSKVIATAKHFPGFSNIELDPAININALMDAPITDIEENYLPFKKASECGVEMVMVGPAIVEQIDKKNPASISQTVIQKLREEIGFKGIILSDDLDAKATLQNDSIEEVAIKALKAGCNYLLLSDSEDHIARVAKEIQKLMKEDDHFYKHVSNSAKNIRILANKYS
jgi:beta-N-acetylhexosaminidase